MTTLLITLADRWPAGLRVRHCDGWHGTVTPAPAGDRIGEGHVTLCGDLVLVYVVADGDHPRSFAHAWYDAEWLEPILPSAPILPPAPRRAASPSPAEARPRLGARSSGRSYRFPGGTR